MVCSQMLAASRDVGRTSHGGNDNRWNRRLPLLSGSVPVRRRADRSRAVPV